MSSEPWTCDGQRERVEAGSLAYLFDLQMHLKGVYFPLRFTGLVVSSVAAFGFSFSFSPNFFAAMDLRLLDWDPPRRGGGVQVIFVNVRLGFEQK